MSVSLQQTFRALAARYNADLPVAEALWGEIVQHYSEANRYYHTLTHLENLFSFFNPIESEVTDRDATAFAIFYHDIIYNPTSHQNEVQSAAFAQQRLRRLLVPEARIEKCCALIQATQNHMPTADRDTNVFTDMDVAILGQDWAAYLTYAKQIRKEYAVYPDSIYNVGRKKVLEHFLQLPRIFKTPFFFSRFEEQAKANLKAETALLQRGYLERS